MKNINIQLDMNSLAFDAQIEMASALKQIETVCQKNGVPFQTLDSIPTQPKKYRKSGKARKLGGTAKVIKDLLRGFKGQQFTSAEMAGLTGQPVTTASSNLHRLERAGLVRRAHVEPRVPGQWGSSKITWEVV